MNRILSWLAVASVAWLAAVLPAQKMELGDRSGREVAVFDVGRFVLEAAELQPAVAAVAGNAGRFASVDAPSLAALVTLLRGVGDGEGQVGVVQSLGTRHVVAMGDKTWIARIEAFLALAQDRADVEFALEVRVVEVDAAAFQRTLLDLLGLTMAAASASEVAVLSGEATSALLRAAKGGGGQVVVAPMITVPNLRLARIYVGSPLAYVRDFQLRSVDGAVIAEPVLGTIEEGIRVDALCAATKDGQVLVDLAFQSQQVEKPLAEFETKLALPVDPLKVQVPRVTGCKASLKLKVAPGSTAVVPCLRSDGKWLLLLATTECIQPPPAAPLRDGTPPAGGNRR